MVGPRTALVLATGSDARTVVAGLPLAVRAALALRAAGFDDVALVASQPSRWADEPLARRGVSIQYVAPADSADRVHFGTGSTLLLAGDLLLDSVAAARLHDAPPGPLWSAAGRLIGVVCAPGDAAAFLGRPDLWAHAPGSGTRLSGGLAVALETTGSADRLERLLLDHLPARAPGDSYLAVLLDRRMSRPLTRLLLRTSLVPSHVTLLSMAAGLLGALGLATVSYWGRLGGVLLLVLSVVLDCIDGDMARAQLAQSPAGARLDVLGDYLVHLAVFVGLAVGLLREGLPASGAWAALALVTGVGTAMALVHVVFVRSALRRGGDLHWPGDAKSLRGRPGAAVIEKLASRDYTYLLLILAAVGHLEWFLYAAAGGAWVFAAIVVAFRFLAVPRRHAEAVPR